MQKKSGFTLIELMVTIAILAIISLFAGPNMMDLVYQKQLESSGRALAMTLSNVRGTAVALKKDVSLQFEDHVNDGDHFYWQSANPDIHILARTLPEGITFTAVGLAKKRSTAIRKALVNNPDFDENRPEDPRTNPRQILSWEETENLVIELCHDKLKTVKSIQIFKSGVIDSIQTKALVGTCS